MRKGLVFAVLALAGAANALAQSPYESAADFAKYASASKALLMGLTIVVWLTICAGVQFIVTLLGERR